MFISISHRPGQPGHDWVDAALDDADPARLGIAVGRSLDLRDGTGQATVVTWHATQSADSDLLVDAVWPMTGTGPAHAAQLTRFRGPRSAAWVAAERRAAIERLLPAVADLRGAVAVFHALGGDGEVLTLSLASSVDVLLEAQCRILGTTLLPWEDAADLTGPDEVEVLVLEHLELPDVQGRPDPADELDQPARETVTS